VVLGEVQRAAQRRRERGLQAARGAGQQPLHAQSEALAQVALALERLGLVAIAGEHERAARAVSDVDAAGPREVRGEGGPEPRALQAQREQRALAGVGLGDGRQHAGGNVRGPRPQLAAVEHEHREPARTRTPGHSEADEAAADDRYVVAVAVAVGGDVVSSRFAGMTRISS
jgi:hypothetical protein